MSTADDRADREMGRPTVDDLEQQNFSHPAVPVRVTDPVPVQQLPARSSLLRSFTLAQDTTEKLLNADVRRSRALVACADADCYIGTDQQGTISGTAAFRVPAGSTIELRSTEQWWVRAVAADAVVSVMSEQWAE